MVLRNCEGRVGAPAVACLAAAGMSVVFILCASSAASAQSRFDAPVPPASVPGGLIWGGRLPAPGEDYLPSRSVRDGTGADNDTRATFAPDAAPQTARQRQTRPPVTATAPTFEPPLRSTSAEATDALLRDLIGRGGFSSTPPLIQSAPPITPPVDKPETIAEEPDAYGAGAGGPSGPSELAVNHGDGPSDVTPGIAPAPRQAPPPQLQKPIRERASGGVIASIDPTRDVERPAVTIPDRGALAPQTPPGYTALPRAEAMCRRVLVQMGVRFTEKPPVGSSKGCGIAHPIRITQIADGVAMVPAATLNCGAAVRISKWVEDEVKSAARWRLWTSPTAVLNASSYRCSRIAGSRTVSEHASGNALDVRGFKFSNGDVFDVEKKGFFSFRQKGFQKSIRRSACEHFGTVLGPGYNHAHRDHLHLDAKNRRRVVCK